MNKYKKKKRPLGVSIIAILQAIPAILIMLVGALMVFIGIGIGAEAFEDALEELAGQVFQGIFIFGGVMIIVLGFLLFLLAKGLWDLNKLAWWIEVILFGLSTISYLVGYETLLNAIEAGYTNPVINAVITIGVFIYLILVRDAFS